MFPTPLEGATQVAESAGMRRAFEKAEHKLMALEQENATLQLKLEGAKSPALLRRFLQMMQMCNLLISLKKLESSTIQIDGFLAQNHIAHSRQRRSGR